MRFIKNVFSQLHSFVLWALASFIFWGWIFTMVTDTAPENKVTVYCYVPTLRDTQLAVALEENRPEGIRMIKVHSFEYVMLNVENIENGDIFILPASTTDTYAELLADPDGGVRVYDAASGQGSARSYIGYTDEDYYLYLGANSVHAEDGKALAVARELMGMK